MFLKIIPDILIIFVTAHSSKILINFNKAKYKLFYKNSRVVYMDLSDNQIKKIAENSLISHLRNIIFSAKYLFINPEKIKTKIEVSGPNANLITDQISTAVILVVPHLDAHLLNAKLLSKLTKKKIIIPLRATLEGTGIENEILNEMSSSNIQFIKLGGAMSQIEKVIESRGIIGLALDAVFKDLKYKESVKFFGYNFEFSTGPVWLAQKYKIPIYTGYSCFSKNYSKVILYLDKEIDLDDSPLQNISSRLEKYILSNPGKWNHPDDYFSMN